MKKLVLLAIIMTISAIIVTITACKKKDKGVCYCSYLSGDKKEFNLNSLPRSRQIDSCYVLDGYAEGFAGSCKLE
jgi:hypothetical protein